jgi:hypothetical protein
MNGTAKLLLLLLSTCLFHAEGWVVCSRRGRCLLEVLVGYHMLLGSSYLTICSNHRLGWKEVHISVRKMMKLLRPISRILVLFVLIACYTSNCLVTMIECVLLTWVLCERSLSIGCAE